MTLNTATVDPQPSATTLQPIVARKELLNGRYDVGPLLGSGRWSQTYLVKDIQSYTIAATKIYSDYATSEGVEKGHIREVQVLERIKEVALDDNLPLLKDHFFHTSASDKKHLCLVLPVFCESVDAWRKKCPGKVLDLQVVKEIIALVLQGLIQLHARGIIHTDIKPDNILIDAASDSTIEKHFESETSGSIPHHYSPSDSAKDKETYTFVLTDLSNAQFKDEPRPTEVISSYALRAPEVILGCPFDEKVDIWAIGCITFELLTGSWLFKPTEGETWTVEDEHLANMLEMTGESVFPTSLVEKAKKRTEFFKEDGTLARIDDLLPVPIEQAFSAYKVLTEKQRKQAADFIRSCLVLDPEQRPSAESLAAHGWLHTAFMPEAEE